MKVESLEAIFRALNTASVPFIVVGGIAVNAHGYGRLTNDVDIVIRLVPETIAAAFRSLATLGYRPRVPITSEMFADPSQRDRWVAERHVQVLSFASAVHRETPIDLFVTEPFDFETEFANALVVQLANDVPVHIVSFAGLLRLKRAAGRPQDLTDVAELLAVHAGPTRE
jgi:hypothetical protein